MGCNSCNKNKKGVVKNFAEAMRQQPSVVKWIRGGASSIIKCIEGETKYTDEEIKKNRDVCRECLYSTKQRGKLTTKSQCMAPDPDNNNAPCACFIACKTQVGDCPLNKWTHLEKS